MQNSVHNITFYYKKYTQVLGKGCSSYDFLLLGYHEVVMGADIASFVAVSRVRDASMGDMYVHFG